MKQIVFYMLFLSICLKAQSGPVELEMVITPYVTYYVSSIDLETGTSNVPIFQATLSNNNAPDSLRAIIDFEITIDSDFLEMDNETLIRMDTDPFYFTNDIILSNLDMTLDTRDIYDVTGQKINFSVNINEHIDLDRADNLFNAVVQTGKLPDGNYSFNIRIFNGDNPSELWAQVNETITLSSPMYLELITPGGVLADTTENEVYTSYPIMQWETDPCNVLGGCDYYIRVSEFNPAVHSTVEEAIESTTRLPLNQSQGWYLAGSGVSSFQYPATDAGELEQGKVYVWQVLKVLGTTSGLDGVQSQILAFKIKDMTAPEGGGGAGGGQSASANPAAIVLQTLMGADQYEAYFGPGGEVAGFSLTGNITLDGSDIDLAAIQAMIAEGIPETDAAGVTTYRPISIVSMEVSQ